MFIKCTPGVQPGNSPIKRPLFEAHVLEGVLQQQDVLSGSLGRLEAVLLVDGPPHPPRCLPAIAGEPLRVDGEVDVVAVVAGLAVDVAEVVLGVVVVKPRLEVSLDGLTQRRVDLGTML
jgi:hypothetical protein